MDEQLFRNGRSRWCPTHQSGEGTRGLRGSRETIGAICDLVSRPSCGSAPRSSSPATNHADAVGPKTDLMTRSRCDEALLFWSFGLVASAATMFCGNLDNPSR